jgi:hypothetical protein
MCVTNILFRPLDAERFELISALHQVVDFAEGLLTLSGRLVNRYQTNERPNAEELAAMHEGVTRWREQPQLFRQRLAALSVEPPRQLQ